MKKLITNLMAMAVLLLSSTVGFAAKSMVCDLTIGDGDIMPIQVLKSSKIALDANMSMDYEDQPISIYSTVRARGKTYVSIATRAAVVSGINGVSYYDVAEQFSVKCSLK